LKSLDLPIYNNFKHFAYHDILQKLAVNVTVLEFVKKEREARIVDKEKQKEEQNKLMDEEFGSQTSADPIHSRVNLERVVSLDQECRETREKLLDDVRKLFITPLIVS